MKAWINVVNRFDKGDVIFHNKDIFLVIDVEDGNVRITKTSNLIHMKKEKGENYLTIDKPKDTYRIVKLTDIEEVSMIELMRQNV